MDNKLIADLGVGSCGLVAFAALLAKIAGLF